MGRQAGRVSAPVLATIGIVVVVLCAGAGHWLLSRGEGVKGKAADTYAVGQALTPPQASAVAADAVYREIGWKDLLPKAWDPMAPFKGLRLQDMADDDPRAQAALEKAKEYWRDAPVEPAMDGVAVRLPGFVVSLDGEGEAIREFLLVPYFGACIHVPPPPANQVVHVRAGKPLEGLRTMDTVWVSGTMRVERAETMMGDAGYAISGARVEAYVQGR
ncbi:DUF3299 domain-containing protein [Cupriavidus necator]|uniref:DUF3299 domain-containing protein n=1 Tax=Cupriavidus necator TaxID=106590 RepID=UPI00339D578B